MNTSKITTSTQYRQTYRGFNLKVLCTPGHYNTDGMRKQSWCGYVWLSLNRLTDKTLASALWLPAVQSMLPSGRMFCQYNDNDFLNSLPFHYGITFYQKRTSDNEDERHIELGCDWQHYGDDYDPTAEEVFANLREVVDHIMEGTTVLCACGGNGALIPEADGEYRHGRFFSNAWTTSRAKGPSND